jgi:hypothetical protein
MRREICEGGARLSINNVNHEQDEAQIILDALREIQDNPELQAQVEKDPESVLDRLGLSTIARHAVTLGITALVVGGRVSDQVTASPNTWWQTP